MCPLFISAQYERRQTPINRTSVNSGFSLSVMIDGVDVLFFIFFSLNTPKQAKSSGLLYAIDIS